MSAKRHDIVAWLVGGFCVGLGVLAFLAGHIEAQESDPPPPTDTGPITNDDFHPFQLYPADEGALTWDDLRDGPAADPTEDDWEGWISPERLLLVTSESRQSAIDIETWAETENGYDVSQAWSRYSDLMAQQAAERQAEYEAGLSGISSAGVE